MPSPGDGFFHALQQDPEDDALRLVFADFLEERGGEQAAAHAELIRTQVRLAALAPDAPEATGRAAELTARQDELLARWQRVWLGEWGDVLQGWTFRRGLVEAIRADASDFLDHAPQWFAAWPTLTVARLSGAGHLLPELAASPWLAHLRGLDLSNNGIDAGALAHLTASRFVSLLQGLDLSDNPIGPRGAALLAGSRSLEELTELHLARCGLWHEGLMALLGDRARSPRPWRRLDLADNGLHRLGLVRLADSPLMGHLEALDLAGNPLGDNGASVLADSPNAAGLIDLGLCDTGSGDVEVAALAGSPNLTGLRSLDLRGHRCWWRGDRDGEGAGGIAALAHSPLLGRLRRLLLARGGPSNGWVAQVLRPVRPCLPPERSRDGWMASLLRNSRYLMPSQLVACDLEELWWLGDTRNRERLPADFYLITDWLAAYPELLDQMDRDQAMVLRLRYGLDESPSTLQETADRLALPRERVREIESAAVARLRRLRNALPFD